MAGLGNRFKERGYSCHKAMIDVNGRSVIERLLSRFTGDHDYFFILSETDQNSELKAYLTSLIPNAKIIFIEAHDLGPSYSLRYILNDLNSDSSILVTYCDYDMDIDFSDFEKFVKETNCDACLISYRGFHAHYLSDQTYAYSRLENDRVVEIKEKGSFTDNRENEFASCGAYYFKNLDLLARGIEYQFELNLIKNNEFYTSLAIEGLLQKNKNTDVRVYEIPFFIHLGTPDDLERFAFWEREFSKPVVLNSGVEYEYWKAYFHKNPIK